jgi:flagellar biosynthesis protein FlhF
MKVKRIFAPDMRQAMRRAREEIGPDAVIVSNHRVAGGVEVVAAHEHEFEAAQAEFKREQEEKERLRRERAERPPSPWGYPDDPDPSDQEEAVYQAPPSAAPVQRHNQQRLDDELRKTRAQLAEARQGIKPSNPFDSGQGRNQQIEQHDEEDLQMILASLKPGAKKAPRTAPSGSDYPFWLDDESLEADPPQAPLAAPAPQVASPAATIAREDALIESMQSEIKELKTLLEQQMQISSRKVWVEEKKSQRERPATTLEGKLAKRFERVGIGQHLADHLIAGLPAGVELTKAWRSSLAKLTESLPVMKEDYIDRGGMIAFVGPTGVGKTTTIGKLAARFVLQHGSAGLALVTTDSYRIAAHEQLKTYGRILDVPVRVVDENNSLEEVLTGLRGKKLVLIDTAGMSQHERHSEAQKEMLTNISIRMKKLLVLSCSSQRQVLEDAYDNYQSIGLNGCVLSKVDESATLGEALTLAVERQLPIAYITDGQKVPDDIEVAQRNDLISRAVITAQKAIERERARQSGNDSALSSAS